MRAPASLAVRGRSVVLALALLAGCAASDEQPTVGTDREPTSSSGLPLPTPDSVPVGGAGGLGAGSP